VRKNWTRPQQYLFVLLTTFIAATCVAQEEIPPISPEMAARWAITDGPDDVYIRVAEPLDEWRYYCLDIPGNRDELIGRQLNVHTCKEGMWHRDTIFSYQRTTEGELYMPEYDLCVETSGEKDAIVFLTHCSGEITQKWAFNDTQIKPQANDQLCITLSSVEGVLTTGGLPYPTRYKSRELSLQTCSADVAERQKWTRTKPMIDLEAPILPDGSSADWRDWVLSE